MIKQCQNRVINKKIKLNEKFQIFGVIFCEEKLQCTSATLRHDEHDELIKRNGLLNFCFSISISQSDQINLFLIILIKFFLN